MGTGSLITGVAAEALLTEVDWFYWTAPIVNL